MIKKNNGKVLFIFTQKMNYMPFSHGIDLAVGGLVRLYSRSCARRKILLVISGTGLLQLTHTHVN